MVVVLLCLVENLHVGYNLLLMNQVFVEMLVFDQGCKLLEMVFV